jgi:hypothetical protein
MLEPGDDAVKQKSNTRPLAGTPRDQAAVTGRAAAELGAEQGENRDGEVERVEEPGEFDIDSVAQWAHWV